MNGENIVTAQDLQDYLRSLCEVNEPSCDQIIIGNPSTKIKKIGTCWQAYFETIKAAYEQGINVLIVHEPTFYSYNDFDSQEFEYAWAAKHLNLNQAKRDYEKAIEEKKKYILDHEMVIIRCHDVMDKIDEFGMAFALGKALGFDTSEIINSKTFFNVYEVKSDKAIHVVQKIANSLKSLGQAGVAFYGDENYEVSSVGIGTGCFSDPIEFCELGADLHITINDSIKTWVQTSFARDTGKPLVVINHGTSEEMGMNLLSQHLTKVFPHIETKHFKQGCDYVWVSGE